MAHPRKRNEAEDRKRLRRTRKRSQLRQTRKEAEKGAGARKRGIWWGALERGSDRLMVVKSLQTPRASSCPDARGKPPWRIKNRTDGSTGPSPEAL